MADQRISLDASAGALDGTEIVPLVRVGSPVSAGSFVVGTAYSILSIGTTDFTLIGAASNTVGLGFVATGAGSGTGTAGATSNVRSTAQTIANLFSATFAGNSDANISSAANYDILQYETSDNKWHNVRNKYILGIFSGAGVLTNSQDLLYHKFSKGVTFPANFGSFQGYTSEATSVANPTASTTINIDKSTGGSFTTVGTIVFSGSPLSATFATVGSPAPSVSFGQGEIIRVQGPASADATLAGVAITLVGYET